MAQPMDLPNPPPVGDSIASWLADVPKWVAHDLALIKKDDGKSFIISLRAIHVGVAGWIDRTETKDKLVHYSRYANGASVIIAS